MLSGYFKLFNNIKLRKTNEINLLKKRIDNYENNVKETSNKMKLLQANYDTVIAKSQLSSKNLAEKKKSEIEISSELDSIKSSFESENEKFLSMLKGSQFKKDIDLMELSLQSFQGNANGENKILNPLKLYNSYIEKLYTNLNSRRDNINNLIDQKKQRAKEEANFEHYDSILKTSSYNSKLFSLISENIKDNTNKFRDEIEKKLNNISKLRKALDERTNSITLNAEKNNSMENLSSIRHKSEELSDEINKENNLTEKLLKRKNSLKGKFNSINMQQDLISKENSKKINVLEEEMEKTEINRNKLISDENEVSFNIYYKNLNNYLFSNIINSI
jgi:hypothetical protein